MTKLKYHDGEGWKQVAKEEDLVALKEDYATQSLNPNQVLLQLEHLKNEYQVDQNGEYLFIERVRQFKLNGGLNWRALETGFADVYRVQLDNWVNTNDVEVNNRGIFKSFNKETSFPIGNIADGSREVIALHTSGNLFLTLKKDRVDGLGGDVLSNIKLYLNQNPIFLTCSLKNSIIYDLSSKNATAKAIAGLNVEMVNNNIVDDVTGINYKWKIGISNGIPNIELEEV